MARPASNPGHIVCGTTITFSSGFLVEILDIQGIGADRKPIDSTTGNSTNLWGTIIMSCIARLTPFRVTIAHSSNIDWAAVVKAVMETCTILAPVEDGYSSGGSLAFKAGVSKYQYGGELEGRVTASVEICPSGPPTIVAGTLVGS